MLIEVKGVKDWFNTVKENYHIKETLFRDSEEAFTILQSPTSHKTIIVARYDRTNHYGVVFTSEEDKK